MFKIKLGLIQSELNRQIKLYPLLTNMSNLWCFNALVSDDNHIQTDTFLSTSFVSISCTTLLHSFIRSYGTRCPFVFDVWDPIWCLVWVVHHCCQRTPNPLSTCSPRPAPRHAYSQEPLSPPEQTKLPRPVYLFPQSIWKWANKEGRDSLR